MTTTPARPAIGGLLYLAFAVTLGGYFTFAAVQGDYGVFRQVQIRAEAETLRHERDALYRDLAHVHSLRRAQGCHARRPLRKFSFAQ